jgi:hypothetical protein
VAALTKELQETSQALREGAFSPQATIRVDAGGMGVLIGAVAASACLVMLAVLIVIVIWLNGQLVTVQQQFTDLKNKDSIHDAYIQQHDMRLSKVEGKK